MEVLQKVLDILNPLKVEEVKDRIGSVLLAVGGLVALVREILGAFGG